MANDFDILRTGGELAANHPQPANTGSNGVNWWLVGGSLVVVVVISIIAYQAGKNTIAPQLTAANDEKEKLKKTLANCPYHQNGGVSPTQIKT